MCGAAGAGDGGERAQKPHFTHIAAVVSAAVVIVVAARALVEALVAATAAVGAAARAAAAAVVVHVGVWVGTGARRRGLRVQRSQRRRQRQRQHSAHCLRGAHDRRLYLTDAGTAEAAAAAAGAGTSVRGVLRVVAKLVVVALVVELVVVVRIGVGRGVRRRRRGLAGLILAPVNQHRQRAGRRSLGQMQAVSCDGRRVAVAAVAAAARDDAVVRGSVRSISACTAVFIVLAYLTLLRFGGGLGVGRGRHRKRVAARGRRRQRARLRREQTSRGLEAVRIAPVAAAAAAGGVVVVRAMGTLGVTVSGTSTGSGAVGGREARQALAEEHIVGQNQHRLALEADLDGRRGAFVVVLLSLVASVGVCTSVIIVSHVKSNSNGRGLPGGLRAAFKGRSARGELHTAVFVVVVNRSASTSASRTAVVRGGGQKSVEARVGLVLDDVCEAEAGDVCGGEDGEQQRAEAQCVVDQGDDRRAERGGNARSVTKVL